jgi:RimJ/RimL family protein N-acetyltransferase
VDPVEITAGRLHLRPWRAGDEDAVLDACTDPETQRWTQVPVPYSRADAEAFVRQYVPQAWADEAELCWAVCDSTTGEPLASVGLHAPHPEGVREVGFWCRPSARGSGVVSDAVQVVARWAFAELGLVRLEWAAEVGNAASLRVAEKAGFGYEGPRRASLRQRDGSPARDGWWAARLPTDGPDGAAPRVPDPGRLPVRDGVVLRRWRTSDADAVRAAGGADDGAVPPPLPGVEDAVAWWCQVGAHQQWAAGEGAPLVAVDGGRVVAATYLRLRDSAQGVAEVGVWTAPAARRQGLTTAALQAHVQWAVPALDLGRLEWRTTEDNAASLALAARLGFARESVERSRFRSRIGDGPRRDSVLLVRVP